MQRVLFYAKHTDKFTSPKHTLLVFQVRANKAQDEGLLGSWCHNFRHLIHSCSSCAVVQLTSLEDIVRTCPFYCSHYIPKICTIVLFLPLEIEQDASSHSENLYVNCGKRGQHTQYIARNRELCFLLSLFYIKLVYKFLQTIR